VTDRYRQGPAPRHLFEYELRWRRVNQHLAGVDTFFVANHPRAVLRVVSVALAKEVRCFGGDFLICLPESVNVRLQAKLKVETGRGGYSRCLPSPYAPNPCL